MAEKNGTKVTIVLDKNDIGQAVDGLQQRLEIYQRTLDFHQGKEYDLMENIEADCDEADCERMVEIYTRILAEIDKQRKEQR